tara:strand:+ start:1242 stop:1490 length:249 start_codon:yes stop_codon:yes gene_type:complete
MFRKTKPKKDRRTIKEERFKKIASRRVQEILNKMRLLRNCANKGNYSYTDEQVKKILNVIDDEWKKVKHEFKKGKSKKEFNL